MLDRALLMLGREDIRLDGRPYRSDCSGFVEASYDSINFNLLDPGVRGVSGTHSLFKSLAGRGRIKGKDIRPGDLLFFHNTWDRNGNKLRDDRFTHVGLAESVEVDGTVTFLHYVSGRVKRDVLNLKHRNVVRDPVSGRTWNSFLRRGGGRTLAGELFFKSGRPLPR